MTDADGAPLEVIPLPMPQAIFHDGHAIAGQLLQFLYRQRSRHRAAIRRPSRLCRSGGNSRRTVSRSSHRALARARSRVGIGRLPLHHAARTVSAMNSRCRGATTVRHPSNGLAVRILANCRIQLMRISRFRKEVAHLHAAPNCRQSIADGIARGTASAHDVRGRTGFPCPPPMQADERVATHDGLGSACEPGNCRTSTIRCTPCAMSNFKNSSQLRAVTNCVDHKPSHRPPLPPRTECP